MNQHNLFASAPTIGQIVTQRVVIHSSATANFNHKHAMLLDWYVVNLQHRAAQNLTHYYYPVQPQDRAIHLHVGSLLRKQKYAR
jgi:hypothetical protein